MTTEFSNKEEMAQIARDEAEELWGPIEPGDVKVSHPTRLYTLRIAAARLQLKIEDKIASVLPKAKK